MGYRAATFMRSDGDVRIESMNPNKALWEKGDFTRIASSMRESGDARSGDRSRTHIPAAFLRVTVAR